MSGACSRWRRSTSGCWRRSIRALRSCSRRRQLRVECRTGGPGLARCLLANHPPPDLSRFPRLRWIQMARRGWTRSSSPTPVRRASRSPMAAASTRSTWPSTCWRRCSCGASVSRHGWRTGWVGGGTGRSRMRSCGADDSGGGRSPSWAMAAWGARWPACCMPWACASSPSRPIPACAWTVGGESPGRVTRTGSCPSGSRARMG